MAWDAVVAQWSGEIPAETQNYVASITAAERQIAARSQSSGDVRHQVVQLALRQVGKPYILGTQGPDTFDCSGLVQWTYAHFGIETGRTTFDQLPRRKSIEPIEIQTGDLMYFQYPWDQHVGILADVNGDGQWDLIEANSPGVGVIVTNDVFDKPLYTDALIGYRSAL